MTQGRIVVGVDGSFSSRRALAWAAEEARLRHCSLEVVYAWSLPAIAWVSPTTALMLRHTDLEQVGEELLAAVVSELGETGVPVETRVVQDLPAEALIERSLGAEMLVLGAHGNDPLAGLLCSTHKQCVRDARCVVVIVPEEEP